MYTEWNRDGKGSVFMLCHLRPTSWRWVEAKWVKSHGLKVNFCLNSAALPRSWIHPSGTWPTYFSPVPDLGMGHRGHGPGASTNWGPPPTSKENCLWLDLLLRLHACCSEWSDSSSAAVTPLCVVYYVGLSWAMPLWHLWSSHVKVKKCYRCNPYNFNVRSDSDWG